ncbi:hypothetical protein [Mucilaginibacter jinjuensis]|uniref:PXPV repeat-containing protein n=1 Tax=Mucilaginibacter jinjuensis TaxID=1176721 RepID=A0ABY7TAR8_9SPHI|nr:hypothetical protein [Mucilaginibacter jinjuensis]WCT13605.1 hypothetical protein PQO05_06610 [Mucilaginibacter jinjuensis]
MKRITFLAVIVALFTINAAKAQVRVHVGLNVGAPVYYEPAPPVYQPAPVVYESAPAVYYGPRYRYYHRPYYVHRYYGPRRVVYARYHRGYRRW